MGGQILSHRDLIVWQKAMDLVVAIYELTGKFSPREMYGLCSQMRRAAVSIPSNITEGRQRSTRRDFRQFLVMACASCAELETQLEIAKRLGFGDDDKRMHAENLLIEVMKMLHAMIAKFNSSPDS